jgi:hypothetical protein
MQRSRCFRQIFIRVTHNQPFFSPDGAPISCPPHMTDVSEPLRAYAAKNNVQSVPTVSWRASGMPSRAYTTDFTGSQIGVVFVALAAITSIPILLNPWPPLSDYINHLSRMYVINAIGSDPDLARFYEIDWQIIPNLMMDLVIPPLERVMNIFVAGQVYTIASFVLILSGTLALNRRLFGHWSVLPLIAFPLLYNIVFLVGTMNYVSGIGLSLWALVAWISLRERNLALRLAVSTLFVLALFFCHLYAVGLYGLGLLAFELHRLLLIYVRPPRTDVSSFATLCSLRPILDFAIAGLPFLPVVPLLLMSSTWGLRGSVQWEFSGKSDGLVFIVEVYSHFAAFVLTAVAAFAAGWAVHHRALQFHTFGWVLLAVAATTYLALPRILFETYMGDTRLPISIAFMVIACARLDLRHDYVRRGFATVLVLLVAIRVFEVQTAWSDLSRPMKSFAESMRFIDRGAKVLVAYAEPDGGDAIEDFGLVHAACLAIIERSALVTTAFTVVGKQIMHVRDEYRARVDKQDGTPPTIEQLLEAANNPQAGGQNYWAHWTTEYDYLYVLFTDTTTRNPPSPRLDTLYSGDRFVLYRIKPDKPKRQRRAPATVTPQPQVSANSKLRPRSVDVVLPLPQLADTNTIAAEQ